MAEHAPQRAEGLTGEIRGARRWPATSVPIIKLRSTAGTGYTYVTTKNKTNTRERIEIKKYDPVIRQHVIFKEER